MTSFGQFPLVYQLRQLSDGSFIPVGLAESSSIAFFSATTLVVSSISATNYQGLNLSSIEITGVVVSIDTTGTGQPIIDTTSPTNPKIRSFAVSLDSFLAVPSVNPGDGEVTLGWGASPLPVTHGGTNSVTPPSNDAIAYWYDGGSGSELTTNAGFSFNGTNISIPNTGQYQINGSQITLSNLAGITSPTTLNNIPAATTPNTFLNYNGTNLIWTSVTGTGTGSTSFPSSPGRIPVTNSTTELVSYVDFTYASATKALSVYAINNVCDVCAVRFNEGGTLLSDKYQGKDDTLTAIAGLNPGSNELIYFTNTNAAATASLTEQGRQLLDDGSFAAMRTTLQLGNIATRDITSPPAGGLYFESDPTGTINTNSNLTFTTNILKSPNVCATTVCATTFAEGGQTLSTKYQGFDSFLNDLANQNTVNLTGSQVCGTLPVTNGGTNRTSFTSNQLIYGQFDQNSNLTFDGTTFLKSPAVCATTVCGADLFENGVNITAKYETQTNAANTYTTKSTYNTFTGTLALSAGLKDVIINAPSNGEVLKWNGANWANATDAGGATIPNGPYAWDGVYIYQDSIPGIDVVQPSTNTKLYYLQSSNGVVKWTLESLNQVQITAPGEFTRNASATQFSGIIIDELSSVDHWNENSYIFYAEVNTLSATNISATNYYNLPNVSALNGTGVFEVTSYSRNNFVLTGTNLALSNTVSNHIASAVHWELSTLNNNYINASGDSANASFFLQDLSATNLSATNYSNLPSSTITWLNAYNAQTIRKYVKNTTGSTIAKGRAVTVVSATGDNVLVAPLSSVNTHVPEAVGFSNHVFGLTETQILNDDFGYIITEGILSGTGGGVNALDTSLFSAGDILYVSSNGLLSNTRPPAPYEAHPVGYVIRSQSNVGSIYVKIETVPEINDIVGFNIASSLLNGDLITYDLTTSTFVNTQSINLSGSIRGGSVSATTVSATNYLNLPSVTALNGTGIFEVTSYSRTNFVLTSTNLELSNTVTGHIASAVHWDLTTLNNNYINASGDSVTGPFFFGTLSATTFSATNYINLPTSALSGLSDTLITSPALSSVLKWNGTKWVAAPDQTGGGGGNPTGGQYAIQVDDGAGGFYGDTTVTYDYDAAKVFISTSNLQVDAIATFNNSTDFTQPVTFTTIQGNSVSSTTVSATTYLNLPSGVATWNANKLQGVNISTATPATEDALVYNGTAWAPKSVIAISNIIGNNLISS